MSFEEERYVVSFVVPCYNESENISKTVAEIEGAITDVGLKEYEILVVDDCSIDSTGAVVKDLAKKNHHIKLITNTQNLGLGGSYKKGVQLAGGTYVILVPGDNAYPREGIDRILARAGEADIVIPFFANPEARTWQRQLASRGFTFVINTLFGLDVPYFNGPVLHKVELLREIEIKTNSFAYQAEALVKLISQGATYCSLPVNVTERTTGRSRAFAPKNVYRVAKAIFLLWYEVKTNAKCKPSLNP